MPTGAPPWRGKAVDYSQIYVLCLWQHPFVSYSGRGIVKEEADADLKPRTQICKKKHNISGVLNFYCEPCGEDWWLETADCFPNIYSSFSSGQIFYPEWQWVLYISTPSLDFKIKNDTSFLAYGLFFFSTYSYKNGDNENKEVIYKNIEIASRCRVKLCRWL